MLRRHQAGGDATTSAGDQNPADSRPACRVLSDCIRQTPLTVWLSELATLLLLVAALWLWAALIYGFMGD